MPRRGIAPIEHAFLAPITVRSQLKKLFLTGLALVVTWLFLPLDRMPGHRQLEAVLLAQLALPATAVPWVTGAAPEHAVIYVLGGTQASLERKFEATGELYRQQGAGMPVLLLQEPGITSFDPVLGRNLTNREWAVRSLEARGVRKERIETVARPGRALFGTLSEARMLRAVSLPAGYRKIVLVTSRLHARRTWRTFTTVFGSDSNIILYLREADEEAGLKQFLIEYGKNLLYDLILLPLAR